MLSFAVLALVLGLESKYSQQVGGTCGVIGAMKISWFMVKAVFSSVRESAK